MRGRRLVTASYSIETTSKADNRICPITTTVTVFADTVGDVVSDIQVGETYTSDEDVTEEITEKVNTGDRSNTGLWIIIAAAAVLALVGAVFFKRRKSH